MWYSNPEGDLVTKEQMAHMTPGDRSEVITHNDGGFKAKGEYDMHALH